MVLLFKIGKEYLLDGVGTVKNAVPDIVIKQRNGPIPQRNIFIIFAFIMHRNYLNKRSFFSKECL